MTQRFCVKEERVAAKGWRDVPEDGRDRILLGDTNQTAPKRGRRTQIERRGEADQRMIDAAISLIAEKGVRGLVLGEVGARAGYSATLPVHYYKTKEALILLTAQRIMSDYNDVLRREIGGADGLAALRTFVRTYLHYAADYPLKRRALFMITSEAAVDAALRQGIADLSRNGPAGVARRIRAGQVSGEIEPMIDPDAIGTLIFAWLRGVISLWAVDPTLDLARLAVGIEGSVVRILVNRDPPRKERPPKT